MICRLPTVREYMSLKYGDDPRTVLAIVQDISGGVKSGSELKSFLVSYLLQIDAARANDPQLQRPYFPEENNAVHRYLCATQDVKLVSDYTGEPFSTVYDMDIISYWGYIHDAIVWNCSKSEAGTEYLDECWTHSQKEPDRDVLKKMKGGIVKRGKQH